MALAPTVYNPGSRGQNSRYDTSQTWFDPARGLYTDGQYFYRERGPSVLSEDRPDVYQAGLPSADNTGGSGTGTGSFLSGDAEFGQLLQDMKAESISDKASRDAGIKRSFINFGLGNFDLAKAAQTTGVGDLASILDPQTLELAKNNQFSVAKRVERGMADRTRDNRVALRQRGGFNATGEHGFLAQRAQTDFDTDMFDSGQKLLDYISGAQAGFAAAERERQRRSFEMALQAALRNRGGGGGYGGYPDSDPTPAAPAQMTPEQAAQYWRSNPAPTGQLPSGQPWYGGFGGLEATRFRGKALDGLS
jgi:predicted pyridoxine 5'-phosphate oxidase superfamily flavin-nucleotide-binding protein